MAAINEIKRIATHQKALSASVEGCGSNFDAPYTAAIDRTIGIAKERAETKNPVRERANHRSLRPSTCSDTHEV
jgi:hypothetical protein